VNTGYWSGGHPRRTNAGTRVDRRRFLESAALAAANFVACSPPVRSAPSYADEPVRDRRRVIVIGAGLAGLTAGYELARAGHHVQMVEARDRPGGRVATLRQPFSDSLYAEAGALFVPNNHNLTVKYANHFGLGLEPAWSLFNARLFYVRGRLVVPNRRSVEWPLQLTPEEVALGRSGMWTRYVRDALHQLGDVTATGWASDEILKSFDMISAGAFLRKRGASAAAVELLRIGTLDLIGDGVESYSALQMLYRAALAQSETHRLAIRGGAEQLPQRFATHLARSIEYDIPVVRIEPGEKVAAVVAGSPGHYRRLTADHVICTLPFSVLRRIEVSPAFSASKQRAIAELPYTSVVRTYLQFRRRGWSGSHGNSRLMVVSDLPVKWIFDHTVNQPGPRGILEAQTTGAEARSLAGMPEADRIRAALSSLDDIFPGLRNDFELGTSKSWDDDAWARGAYPYFRPGQMQQLLAHIARPEGRVHFAGEHTSAWSGYMQGAIESGLRVAREIDPSVSM
jgi:monoamine oxidase